MKSIGWKNKLLKSKLKSNSESSFIVIHGHCRMEKMIKKSLFVAGFCFMLLCFLISDPQTAYAYNVTNAVNYADTWAEARNPGYTQFSSDCTNFVSQVMRAGGASMNNNWFYNNSRSYSRTWSVADDFKWYIKDVYGATRLASGWTRDGRYHGSTYLYPYINDSSNIPNTGRVVIFYDWDDNGQINHSAYCVGTGYSNDQNIYADLIDRHTTDRYRTRWTLHSYNPYKDTTAIYAFGI